MLMTFTATPQKKSKPFFTHLLSLFEPLPNIVFLFKFPHRSCCVAVFVLHVSVAVFLLFTCFLLSFFFFFRLRISKCGTDVVCHCLSSVFFFSPFSSLTRLTARKSRVRGIFVKQPSTEAVFFFFTHSQTYKHAARFKKCKRNRHTAPCRATFHQGQAR